MRHAPLAIIGALTVAACGHRPIVVPTAEATAAAERRLAAADALVHAGCLDCLEEAFGQYDAMRSVAGVSRAATAGAARTAALIAVRERDLGIDETGTLQRARDLVAPIPDLAASLAPLFEVVESLPAQTSGMGGQITRDAQLEAASKAYRNRDAWTGMLGARADEDPFAAYLALGFECAYGARSRDDLARVLDAMPSWHDEPLIRFRAATCGSPDMPALRRLLDEDPRFVEVVYYQGLNAILAGKLDDAAALLARANDWRPRWPAVTYTLANVAMTGEDFDRAVEYYDRTLTLVPDHPDAWLGKVRALTYLGRYTDALTAVDRLLDGRWHVGDARYFQALNESQLGREDEAWIDVQEAEKLISNADVPKLAGMIAWRRGDVSVARERFELAHARNAADCETDFDLGGVWSEQRAWPQAIDVLNEAVGCFTSERAKLEREIARIRASDIAPDRRDVQIARRERQIASDDRSTATAWFNLAAASFNMARYADARDYASHVAGDELLSDRVSELLSRIPPGQ